VVLVPTAAVQHNGTAAFVYTVSQGAAKSAKTASQQQGAGAAGAKGEGPSATVHVQAINVLTNSETQAAVEGVASGTQLATSGFDRLENGASVVVHQGGNKGAKGSAALPGSPAKAQGNSAP
jgi:multidrug efflux system membrane fusion protein